MKRKIIFLTGTRADFGKLKSLIEICRSDEMFEVHIFATGMHQEHKYGYTVDEIVKCGYDNIYHYSNQSSEKSMDITLAKTIEGFSKYVKKLEPDLIIIHGDRVEALAGSIVGALNNVLVAHIEGGEVSGTIDELIRHSVSKMSHTHFVANKQAKKRLIQMGEIADSIFVIGSPDVDIMMSDRLPDFETAKKRYEIEFDKYAVLMFHPITTEIHNMAQNSRNLVDAVIESGENYIVIYPNNDMGSSDIITELERLKGHDNFRVYPSLRFEYFLTLIKHAKFIIGNSSAGIREAPYYGLPAINIGTRQQNRALHSEMVHCGYKKQEILCAINQALNTVYQPVNLFGEGESDKLFYGTITKESFWQVRKQKQFKDLLWNA